MAVRYFLISETGDTGAWVVDVELGTVQRVEEDAIASGTAVPGGDLFANLGELRQDRDFVVTKGVGLAIAADSTAAPSAHTRREGGND